MGLVVDTSVLVAIERAGDTGVALLERLGDQAAAVSAVTASELLHGAHRADRALRRARRERFVEGVLEFLPVLAFDLDVARVHAGLWADLRVRGELIGAHDLIIAATALHHGWGIVTANEREFRRVTGLEVVLWE